MNRASSIYREISLQELTHLMESHFGPQPGLQAHLLKGGLFNTTYLISLTSPKSEVVVRLGPVNRHLLMPFERNLMAAEAHVYQLCEQHGVPTSKVLILDTSRTLIDRDFMVVERIPGAAISELPLEETEKRELFRQMGKAARGMHDITGKKFGRVSQILEGGGFDSWKDAMLGEIACWKQVAKPFNLYSDSEFARIDATFARHAHLFDDVDRPRLAHTDLWAGNALAVKRDGKYELAAIIDADRAMFGDINFDFVRTGDAFIEGYGVPLDMSESAVIRRKLYLLLYHLLDGYVWIHQYNNPENSRYCHNFALTLMDELLK